MAIGKLKIYKSPGNDQIPELTQAGGITVHFESHTLIDCIWNKEDLPQQ